MNGITNNSETEVVYEPLISHERAHDDNYYHLLHISNITFFTCIVFYFLFVQESCELLF